MDSNLARRFPENQPEDFHQDRRKRFKEMMLLQILLSRRERKAIADDMRISQGLLSDWLNEKTRESMPAHWLDAWTREVGPGLLAWVAKENGFQLVRNEDAPPTAVIDGSQLLALIAKHCGCLVAAVIQAREDGIIDDDERRQVYPEFMRLIGELEAEAERFRPNVGRRVDAQ